MTDSTSVIDVRDTASILEMLGIVRPIQSPWAILLVCFQDDPPDPQLPTVAQYEKTFTKTGVGTMNVVDCFTDMSHGKIDMSRSKVFGWFRLSTKRATWSFPTDASRYLDAGKQAATAAGVRLSDFAGVCVSGPKSTDTRGWVGGMAALIDEYGAFPSIAGQEMGHGYGLDHARLQGNEMLNDCPGPTADYQDAWDLMSTRCWPEMCTTNPAGQWIGPGLNAWNMRSRGWLNEARVWSPMIPTVTWEETVVLRPLHQPEQPGWLAAELGPYLVEMRVKERWDAAIPRACVLIHRFSDNHSYLQHAISGVRDLVKGERFIGPTHTGHYELEVEDVDDRSKTARVHLIGRPYTVTSPPILRIAEIVAGLSSHRDAMIFGERVVSVPSSGQTRALIEKIGAYLETEIGTDVAAALSSRRRLLTEMAQLVGQLYHEAEDWSERPPGVYD